MSRLHQPVGTDEEVQETVRFSHSPATPDLRPVNPLQEVFGPALWGAGVADEAESGENRLIIQLN